MSMTHLDESIDVHAGGQDLVFPTTRNEIAQSEGRLGRAVREVLAPRPPAGDERREDVLVAGELLHHPDRRRGSNGADVVRTFLLSTAYHNRAVYSEETIAEATERWETLGRGYERAVEACDDVDAYATTRDESMRAAVATIRGEFERAMNDDFNNTREALAALTELVGAVNVHVDGAETFDYQGLRAAIETLEEFGATCSASPSATSRPTATSPSPRTWSNSSSTSGNASERRATTSGPTNCATKSKPSAWRCRTPTTARPTGSSDTARWHCTSFASGIHRLSVRICA